jgi:ABC-type lipoprotein release transport system permease subunit
MGTILLIGRLAGRDLRHRPAQAALLFLAVTVAIATLTLGLVLRGVTSNPYQQTRAATRGPDIVAAVFPGPSGTRVTPGQVASLEAVGKSSGVTTSSGPYPVTWASLRAAGHPATAMFEGRDQALAAADQPALTQGSWVRPGAAVIERAFADALGVRTGDRITLGGRSLTVAGIAVTAAISAYPHVCKFGCLLPDGNRDQPGLIWLTRADALNLAQTSGPLVYALNLRLANPAAAGSFADAFNGSHEAATAPYLTSWQDIRDEDATMIAMEQRFLMTGSWLLVLLAMACVAVLVGGRMADQGRRVGLLKAVGATPWLVGVVLLAEHVALALAAAAAGLLAGWLAAPLLSGPGAGLIGSAGATPVTPQSAGLVAAVALAVAALSSFGPAIRAARTSTVAAPAEVSRPPRRRRWLLAVSARLPVPLLLGLRLAARRPRRMLLNAASITVTSSGIVAVLVARARLGNALGAASGLDNPQTDRADQVLFLFSMTLVILATVNALVITWATALDARHTSALARALGATRGQVSTAVVAAQLIPALAGALLGVPGGIGLVAAIGRAGALHMPPAWSMLAAVAGTLVAVAALTAIPARIGTRHPPARILSGEA